MHYLHTKDELCVCCKRMLNFFRKASLSLLSSPLQQNTRRSVSMKYSSLFTKDMIPYFSLGIGAFALGLQMLVLHPWHDRLSAQFTELEREIKELDNVANEFTRKMERIVEIGKEVKAKERRNMMTSQEILTKIQYTKQKMESMHQSPSDGLTHTHRVE